MDAQAARADVVSGAAHRRSLAQIEHYRHLREQADTLVRDGKATQESAAGQGENDFWVDYLEPVHGVHDDPTLAALTQPETVLPPPQGLSAPGALPGFDTEVIAATVLGVGSVANSASRLGTDLHRESLPLTGAVHRRAGTGWRDAGTSTDANTNASTGPRAGSRACTLTQSGTIASAWPESGACTRGTGAPASASTG